MDERHEKWWRFINWLWEMCKSGQRTWDHPENREEALELRAHFEETCPDWKKGDTVKNMPARINELPAELPL